jgi:HAD superfamily hydrolase (TIGR01549 family)
MREPHRRIHSLSAADFDGIVFDLDGVLVDTWDLYLGVYRNVMADVLDREVTDNELVENARTTESGTLHAALPAELVPYGYERFQHWYATLFDDLAAPFTEAVEAVLLARETGKRVGVFTGKTRRTALFTLERFGVADFVECLSSEDDAEPKPHHGGLVRIIDALAVSPGRTLYIGDQRSDVRAGRTAGTAVAAALWTDYANILPEEDVPDLVFDTPGACRDFFQPDES